MGRPVHCVDAVFYTMLGVQGEKVRPCDVWKIGKELAVLVSWMENSAEVKRQGPCFTKLRRKMCFSVHESLFPQVH